MNSNRYAKFFVAGFVLIAFVAAFRFALLWHVQYAYMDGEFPWWMQQKDYVRAKGDVPEVIFLGDSRMKAAVNPNGLCGNAYNLAVSGGSTIEMYYSLRRYLKSHPKPEKVIMGFAAVHYIDEESFTWRNLYFHFLPFWEQLVAQYVGYRTCGWTFPQFREKIIDTLKYDLLFPQKYSAACINSGFRRGEFNRSQYQRNAADKGHQYFGTAESTPNRNGDAGTNFIPDGRGDFYLRKIISLCKERGIPLFIEQLPVNEASYQHFSETDFYPKYKKYLLTLSAETGVPVECDFPCYPPECFGDVSHVNWRGAERFSAEIKAKYGL